MNSLLEPLESRGIFVSQLPPSLTGGGRPHYYAVAQLLGLARQPNGCTACMLCTRGAQGAPLRGGQVSPATKTKPNTDCAKVGLCKALQPLPLSRNEGRERGWTQEGGREGGREGGQDGLDWTGLDWTGLDWIGLDWIGLDCIGLHWVGLGWIGLGWSGLGSGRV